MSKFTEKAKEELVLILPPAVFFFVALHIIALIRSLMSKSAGIHCSSSLSIAVAALILMYCTMHELVRVIGKEKVTRIFFAPMPYPTV